MRNLQRAYRLDHTLREARLSRAILLWREMGASAEAISEFDGLLQDDPGYAPALLNRALAHQQAGQFQEALTDIRSYMRLPVDDPEYLHYARRLAVTLQQLASTPEQMANPPGDEPPA